MKITFIYPDLSTGARGKFYAGLGSLAAVAAREGFETDLVHVAEPVSEDRFRARLLESRPGLAAISATTNMFGWAARLARWSKAALPELPVVVGGVHATLQPEETLCEPAFDAAALGEGEWTLVEAARRIEAGQPYDDVAGLWTRTANGSIRRNPLRPLIADLDALPFPDRDVFGFRKLVDFTKNRRATMMASRGCPYSCTYCANRALRELLSGGDRYVRFRSPENVVAEAVEIRRRYPDVTNLVFHDDILLLDKNWFGEFAERYARQVGLPFSMNGRANLIDEEGMRLARQAGCRSIALGVESGSERMRREFLGRPMSDADLERAFRLCHEAGIAPMSFNMVGTIGEGPEDVLATAKLNARLGPSGGVQVSIFYPYPGTELYDRAKAEGRLTGRSLESYFEDSVVRLERMTPRQVRRYFRSFRAMVALYRLAPRALHGLVDRVLARRWGLGIFAGLVALGRGLRCVWRRTFGRVLRWGRTA
jgi:anaerobic magnesium-protoporphyrin IX monomethyl ester cyclase